MHNSRDCQLVAYIMPGYWDRLHAVSPQSALTVYTYLKYRICNFVDKGAPLALSLSLSHVLNNAKPLYDYFLQSSTSWKLHAFILFGVFQKLYINAGWRQQLWHQLWQTTHILSKSQIPLESSSVQMTMINNLTHSASHNQYCRLLPVPVWKNRPDWYDLRQYQSIPDNTRTCLVAVWGNISLIPGLYWSQSQEYICHIPVKKSALNPNTTPVRCWYQILRKIQYQYWLVYSNTHPTLV
jgi:hypothetical protein